MYKEDVFSLLKGDDEFADYTMQQLESDLDALVRWKNLTPIQDPGKVYTIADYKNKQYRYTMSEYAVEIERLTVRLENLFMESANLSTNFFVRLEKSLEDSEMMQHAALKEVNEWWSLLQEDFKRLNQNYQDYLRDFYSGKTEHLMKSVEFVLHKDKFIKYLNEFVIELQQHSKKIEQILMRRTPMIEEVILEKVVQSEMEIPHALLEANGKLEPDIRENVVGKWESLKAWFIDMPENECESRKVLKITNDIIRSIIQNAALIVQLQNWGISRKDDYQKFLEMFLKCESMEDADCLSAHVFGIQNIEHFKTNCQREEDRINLSVYDEDAIEFYVKPHNRTYKEKKDKRGFYDKSLEKMMQREAYLKSVRDQKDIVMRYVKDKKIVFAQIDETVSEMTRNIFLQWIATANMSSEKTGLTEFGQEYRLIRNEGTCILKCEDGNLTMPAYVVEFV
jgi:uncharacterized protein (TIGR02677 family)